MSEFREPINFDKYLDAYDIYDDDAMNTHRIDDVFSESSRDIYLDTLQGVSGDSYIDKIAKDTAGDIPEDDYAINDKELEKLYSEIKISEENKRADNIKRHGEELGARYCNKDYALRDKYKALMASRYYDNFFIHSYNGSLINPVNEVQAMKNYGKSDSTPVSSTITNDPANYYSMRSNIYSSSKYSKEFGNRIALQKHMKIYDEFINACKAQDLSAIKALVEKYKQNELDVHAENNYALYIAMTNVKNANYEVVDYLLSLEGVRFINPFKNNGRLLNRLIYESSNTSRGDSVTNSIDTSRGDSVTNSIDTFKYLMEEYYNKDPERTRYSKIDAQSFVLNLLFNVPKKVIQENPYDTLGSRFRANQWDEDVEEDDSTSNPSTKVDIIQQYNNIYDNIIPYLQLDNVELAKIILCDAIFNTSNIHSYGECNMYKINFDIVKFILSKKILPGDYLLLVLNGLVLDREGPYVYNHESSFYLSYSTKIAQTTVDLIVLLLNGETYIANIDKNILLSIFMRYLHTCKAELGVYCGLSLDSATNMIKYFLSLYKTHSERKFSIRISTIKSTLCTKDKSHDDYAYFGHCTHYDIIKTADLWYAIKDTVKAYAKD
jgi:hypothetical protein